MWRETYQRNKDKDARVNGFGKGTEKIEKGTEELEDGWIDEREKNQSPRDK